MKTQNLVLGFSRRLCGLLFVALVMNSAYAVERLAPCDVLTGGVLLNDAELLVVGVRGQLIAKAISQSEDGCELGANNGWRSLAAFDAKQKLSWTGIFPIQNVLWLTGHREALYQSDDSGKSWRARYLTIDSDYAVMAVLASPKDDQLYYAVGTRGLYLVSQDQGLNWQEQDLFIDPEWEEPEDFNLNAIVGLTTKGLLVAGEAGALYWSKDGEDWSKDNAGYNGTWFGGLALDNGGVVAFGFAGHLAYAKGYKKDWQLLQSPRKASLFAALKLANGSVVLGGEKGQLWHWQPGTEVFRAIKSGTQATITSLLSSSDELLLITDQGLKRVALAQLP